MQGRDTLVDQELGEAVDRYRQLDEALETRRRLIALPLFDNAWLFCRSSSGEQSMLEWKKRRVFLISAAIIALYGRSRESAPSRLSL